MRAPERKYWFPAKRYGWGWGFPITWQGWIVLVLAIAAAVTDGLLFPPSEGLLRFLALELGVAIALILVCWLTGEPPRWRWGGD